MWMRGEDEGGMRGVVEVVLGFWENVGKSGFLWRDTPGVAVGENPSIFISRFTNQRPFSSVG